MTKQVEVPAGVETLTLVRRGERVGSSRPDYRWWQELPGDELAEHLSAAGYEIVGFLRVSDLPAIYKHFSDRLLSDEAVARGMRCLIEQGRWTPGEGSDEEPANPLDEFRDAVAATLHRSALQATSIPTTSDEEG